MPIWSEILRELSESRVGDGPPDFDGVRRKYLWGLNQYTGRDTILYASAWVQKNDAPPELVSVVDDDINALMEVVWGLNNPNLDLILHSPGGSIEAAESIVSYLRTKFSNIRVIVPQLAMSAATMIACAADEIILGNHSSLGPTDAQIGMVTPLGGRYVSAQNVLDQFDRALRECSDPAKLPAWLPMLQQYGPDLLVQCETGLELSRELVKSWLESYMFKGSQNASQKAESVSGWLADHRSFKSHSRHISRDELSNRGLNVSALESDQPLQDLSLSVFHATVHTFSATPIVKVVENHNGRAYLKVHTPGTQ